jgi:hypothetical protein
VNRHSKAVRTGSIAGNRNVNPHGVRGTRRRRLTPLALVPAVVLLLGLVLSASASAEGSRFFKENFGSAAQPTFVNPQGLAVDYSTGDLLVMDQGSGTISRFNPDGTPDDFSALGSNVISETPQGPLAFAAAIESQIAVDNSGTATDGNIYVTQAGERVINIFARSGEFLGRLTEAGSSPFAEACGVAVGPGGAVYVGDYSDGIDRFSPTANPPTDADFDPNFQFDKERFPPCTLAAGLGPTASALFAVAFSGPVYKLSGVTGESFYQVSGGATTTATVDPETGNVFVAGGDEVIEYDASGSSEATKISALTADSSIQGVAVSPSGEVYVSRAGASGVEVFSISFPSPETEPATAVGVTTATLHGALYPEGLQYTDCKFEYGLATSAAFEHSVPCNPGAAAISPDFARHEVSAALSGLEGNSTYRFRLTATNGTGTFSGDELTFTTFGKPQITGIRARDADQTSVTLEAKINPSGFGTSYRFEWGSTTSYGHEVPAEFEPYVGSGREPVLVTAKISGLAAGSLYHYRVVASNSVDVTASPDQILETLNTCGLPEGRCFELVSPREAGPVALPGEEGVSEIGFQAASAPGSLAYVVDAGFPDATKGARVLYRGTRGSSGWSSTQLSAPILTRNETKSTLSSSSATYGLSHDLSCGVMESNQPLTPDPTTRPVVEAGGANLYRQNPDGSYTAISELVPENLSLITGDGYAENYQLDAFSSDCGKVVFRSRFKYPGVPGVASPDGQYLYEWDEGTLRSVGVVPGPSGETMVGALPGTGGNHIHVVSEDGSRAFFTAERQTSDNPDEIGKAGIFVREDGTVTRDLSISETSTPSTGATYQYASVDGSRVFFTANAGLTEEASDEGIDLYEYDLESERLTDLSVDRYGDGAHVAGFVGGSMDGSRVYFAAAGQLVTGQGRTLAENKQAGTYSIYETSAGGDVSYAGAIRDGKIKDLVRATVLDGMVGKTSRVSPDGRYLLFESNDKVTDYDNGGLAEAYLYDAEATTEATVCVSCRQDGRTSTRPLRNRPLKSAGGSNPLFEIRSLVDSGGEVKVFFTSLDRLATGAVEGRTNIYEWSHGQIFHIATEPAGLRGPIFDDRLAEFVYFAGANADGTDLYLATTETLNWEDGDDRISVYDARIGGGFPEPAAPPPPCNPAVESSCQAPGSQATPNPSAASKTFSGPGNPKAKHHKKKHKKKKKQHKKKNQAQHANGNGRAGK